MNVCGGCDRYKGVEVKKNFKNKKDIIITVKCIVFV